MTLSIPPSTEKSPFLFQVIANPTLAFIGFSVVFVGSVIVFGLLYWMIDFASRSNLEIHNGKLLQGFSYTTPGFSMSDSLRERQSLDAINDLRLSQIMGAVSNIRWQSFRSDSSFGRTFPDSKKEWEDFADTTTRGMSAFEMVEVAFAKYSPLQIRFLRKDEHSFDSLPVSVLAEYLDVGFPEMYSKLESLSQSEKAMLDELNKSKSDFNQYMFGALTPDLSTLRLRLMEAANKASAHAADPVKFKKIFYGEVLSQLTSPGTVMEFKLSSLPYFPQPFDYFYISAWVATGNVPSEFTPAIVAMRIAMTGQLLLSYFLLGTMVAIVAKVLNLA